MEFTNPNCFAFYRNFFPLVQHVVFFFSPSFPLEERSLLQLKALGYTSWVY